MLFNKQRLHIESDFSVDMDVVVVESSSNVEKYSLVNVQDYVKIDDYLFHTLLLWVFNKENNGGDFKKYLLDVLTYRVVDYDFEDYNRIKCEIENIQDTCSLIDCLDQILLIQNMINSVLNCVEIKDMVIPTKAVVDELKHLVQRAKLANSVIQQKDRTILPIEVAQSENVTFKYSFHDLNDSDTTYEHCLWNRPTLTEYRNGKFTFPEEFAIVYNVLYDKWFIWSK